jgi:tetratricopeptide (TPR) repeat protein
MKDKKKDYLESAMKTINKVQTIENNPSLFMIRGLLHYALGDMDNALKDLDQCLSDSTKPNPLVFYLVGMIFAQTGRYSEAIV